MPNISLAVAKHQNPKFTNFNNVVYEIKCLGSAEQQCGRIYIGTTKRSLEIRIKENEADIKKQKETTALAQHIKEHKHTADLSSVNILDKERKSSTIESLNIQQKIDNTKTLTTLMTFIRSRFKGKELVYDITI